MPKTSELIRVSKVDYYPRSYMKFDIDTDLILYIWGTKQNGDWIQLKLFGTEPRFWVKTPPDKIAGFPHKIRRKIVRVERGGKTLKGEQLHVIYVKYPFEVPEVREPFEWTGQADVPYRQAVRIFYDIGSVIRVPKVCVEGKQKLLPDMIELVEKPPDIPPRVILCDIETDDEHGFAEPKYPTGLIHNITAQDLLTGKLYHGTTAKVDPKLVRAYLTKTVLLEAVTKAKHFDESTLVGIPSSLINVYSFHETDAEGRWAEEERERRLVDWFMKLIRKLHPTEIVSHGPYDLPYIRERTKVKNRAILTWNRKHPDKIPRTPFMKIPDFYNEFDFMEGFSKLLYGEATVRGRRALDWIGHEVLGYGKLVRDPIHVMYKERPEHLSAYNIWDTELIRRIELATDVIDFHQHLASYSGTDITATYSNRQMVEALVMYRLRRRDEVLPSCNSVVKSEVGEAGYVHPPPVGLIPKMIELDLKGEYACVIMTCNMDSSSKLGPNDSYSGPVATVPSGRRYRLSPRGLIPALEREIFDERTRIQTEMKKYPKDSAPYKKHWNHQRTIKFFMHSFTGLLGSVGKKGRPSRLADGEVATDIWAVAREHLHWNKKVIETETFHYREQELKLKVVYQDTDSCKIQIENLEAIEGEYPLVEDQIREIGEMICERLLQTYDDWAQDTLGVDDHCFGIKVESVPRLYYQWGAKKRYAYCDWEGQIHTRGSEIRRSDSAAITRECLDKFFTMLFDDASRREIGEYFCELETEIRGGKRDLDCGRPRGVNKANPRTQQFRAISYSNKYLGTKFKVGDKPTLYYVKGVIGKPSPANKVAALNYGDKPSDFGLILDYDVLIDKLLETPMNNVLRGLSSTWKDLKAGGIRQTNFDEVF